MMNPFDMAIGVILGYCVIRGIFRGIIREAAAIVGVLGGFYIAYLYYDALAPLLSAFITNIHYVYIVSFLVIFCGIFVCVTLLGVLIRTLFRLMLLGVVDRMLGALFGAVKGIIAASFLFFLLTTFLPPGGAAMVRDAVMAPPINALAGGLVHVIPEADRKAFADRMETLKKRWEKNSSVAPAPGADKE